MPFVGVTILPVAAGSSNSVAAPIIAHLARLFPSEAHEAYNVDHRLLVNTSSLLPGTNSKDRAYTQILTSSHNSKATFVTTRANASASPATIIIPTTSQDTFAQLLVTKFQPLWALRQSLFVDGVRLRLPLESSGTWHISLGDLKIAAGGGRPAGAANVGHIRGVLIELQCSPAEADLDQSIDDDRTRYASLFGDLLKSLLRETGDYRLDDISFTVAKTDDDPSETNQENGLAICQIYTTIFRNSRT